MKVSSHRCLQSVVLLLLLVTLSVTMSVKLSAAKDSPKNNFLLYVGTYTEKESKGIYAYRFDAASADITPLGVAAETTNPSFLAIDPFRRLLYAVNEVQTYQGASSGAVSAFTMEEIDQQNGRLSFLNEVPSRGADPCYITFDKTGKFALVANYTGGSIAVFPVQPNGTTQPWNCARSPPRRSNFNSLIHK